MVIKGGARGGAADLAAHLKRTDTNERAALIELYGVSATDLDGALREMEAVASGARSKRPFYHASINTQVSERLTGEQRTHAIKRLGAELGLDGQPYAVMEHVKAGRVHVHVAWSRIDGETLTAIRDSHNYRKHEIVARELERQFGHQRVQGAHHERDGVERPGRTPAPEQMQQAARTGITPQEAKAKLGELWSLADSGKAFAAALDGAGWTLARGDKRDVLVALDPAGGTHAINKAVTGLTATHVRQRLADLDRDALPSVETARAEQRRQPEPAPAPTLELDQAPTPHSEPQEQTPPAQQAELEQFLSPEDARRAWAEQLKGFAEGEAREPQKDVQKSKEPSGGKKPPDAAPPASNKAASNAPKAEAASSPEPSRLRQALDRARERLDALGNRLDQAFSRIRDRFLDHDKDRKKEANAAEENNDARKARDRQERAQQLARELLRRWDDQKKQDGPSR